MEARVLWLRLGRSHLILAGVGQKILDKRVGSLAEIDGHFEEQLVRNT